MLDSDAIQHALLNLATNAVDALKNKKSTADWSPMLFLRTKAVSGWAVEYQVEDNGEGIHESLIPKLFQRFFTTKGSHGTGIGLMLTQKIVDQHDGRIDVTSKEENGTLFSIRLPLR
jgi:signal transduction histidine kinase